jgi:hypothetical protein
LFSGVRRFGVSWRDSDFWLGEEALLFVSFIFLFGFV